MDSDASRKSGTNYSDTNSVESPLSVALDLGRLFVAGDGGVGRVRWVRQVSTNCLKYFLSLRYSFSNFRNVGCA